MGTALPRIFGILNVTRDSFSDGGQYLDVGAAVEHGLQMVADGAYAVDVGAESSHPDTEDVPAADEIARLTPVIERLKAAGVRVSVDTWKPEVMRRVLALGADFINDITALRTPGAVETVRGSGAGLILMHSVSHGPRAERVRIEPQALVGHIMAFFQERLRELEQAGVERGRLILDPGMGMFLGTSPAASLAVLRDLPCLAELGRPIMVSTSRKSFTAAPLGRAAYERSVEQRGPATLASEIWAATHGAAYIRTHDVRALHDALTLWGAIEGNPNPARKGGANDPNPARDGGANDPNPAREGGARAPDSRRGFG